jgi:hypothetical protein
MRTLTKALNDAPPFKLNGDPNEIGDEVNYKFEMTKGQCSVIQLTPPKFTPSQTNLHDTIPQKERTTMKFTPPRIKPNDTIPQKIRTTVKFFPPVTQPLFKGATTLEENQRLMGGYLSRHCNFSASLTDQNSSISVFANVIFDAKGKVKSVQPGDMSNEWLKNYNVKNISDKPSDIEKISKALYAAPEFKLKTIKSKTINNQIGDEVNYLFTFQKRGCTVRVVNIIFHPLKSN